MNEIVDECESQRPWLSPTEALHRFQPTGPAGAACTSESVARQVRHGFRIGSIGLLTPTEKPRDVIQSAPVYPIPKTERWLLGVINLRGNLIPVFDLHTVLEEDEARRDPNLLLVVGKGEDAVGIGLDALPRPVDATVRSSQLPPLPDALADYCPAAYVDGDETWLEFELEAFFAALAPRAARG